MVLEEVDLNYIYSVLQEDPNDFSVLRTLNGDYQIQSKNGRTIPITSC